ncbi:ABC transporter ATP-binding protein [Oscillospiraceae bacterium LCP25S3_F9]
MELLQVKNLSFAYPKNEKRAIDDVSFNIEKGSFNVVFGESGCGKTTLLKLIKKEIAPYGELKGSIIYNNKPIDELPDKLSACEIGFVGQNPDGQIVTDKVWHELAFGLENMGESTNNIRRRVGEMASYFGIQNWYHRSTDSLSGGQKQLLNLASVMAMQPKLLLLDEPTSQLDPIAAADFIATLQKLNREFGLTILLVEHRLEEVFPIADKVIAMDSGKILACGSPVEVAKLLQKSKLSLSLPTAVRIWYGLGSKDVPPMTVRQGKDFLEKHYSQCAGRSVAVDKYSGAETVLEAKNVYFRYEKNLPDVLKNFNIAVTKGEIFSILGGNGTGKTTALNVLSGLDKPYKGSSNVFGKKISKYKGNSLYRNMVAMLPQNPIAVFVQSTVKEDFYELLKAMDIPKDSAEKKVNEVTEIFNIEHLLNKHPYDLSGGEQQKAALAKLMLTEPKIILLDEPTKGLDAFYKESFAHILRKIKDKGVTSIIVTHDVEFAAEVSDRCGLFFDGQIIALDTPNEFFCNNSFYTTAASRISRELFKNAVLCSQVIQLCSNEAGEECP